MRQRTMTRMRRTIGLVVVSVVAAMLLSAATAFADTTPADGQYGGVKGEQAGGVVSANAVAAMLFSAATTETTTRPIVLRILVMVRCFIAVPPLARCTGVRDDPRRRILPAHRGSSRSRLRRRRSRTVNPGRPRWLLRSARRRRARPR